MSVVDIESFDADVLQAEAPVLVKFWAEWCGPCKAMAPLYEELSAERTDVTFAKLNMDRDPTTPPQYGVRGIPAFVLFKDGNVIGFANGSMNKNELDRFIDEALGAVP